MFVTVMLTGACQGYYQGNPLKLTEDCQVLQPTIFPSVPRLYNKIYAKINAGLDAATGCKKWLIDRGMASKRYYLT
jgi:long-chain acyl-CoA synthetase